MAVGSEYRNHDGGPAIAGLSTDSSSVAKAVVSAAVAVVSAAVAVVSAAVAVVMAVVAVESPSGSRDT